MKKSTARSEQIAATDQARAKEAINSAMELLNRRWMLRVIWELRQGPITFRALQTTCSNVSASVLNQRLSDLKAAGLVEHQDKEGYVLNDLGRRLLKSIQPLMKWAIEWHTNQS